MQLLLRIPFVQWTGYIVISTELALTKCKALYTSNITHRGGCCCHTRFAQEDTEVQES